MEDIADERLWILSMYLRISGCNNDITVFDSLPVAMKIANGLFLRPAEYTVSGIKGKKTYFLVKSIYAVAPLLCRPFSAPQMTKTPTSQWGRRSDAKMWSVHRACFKERFTLFPLQATCSTKVAWSSLWSVVWFSKTWWWRIVKNLVTALDSMKLLCVSENTLTFFVRNTTDWNKPPPGSIVAICAVTKYFWVYYGTKRREVLS